MEYYVYCHKKPSGEIFYIGKGKKDRCKSKLGRNKIWQRIVNKHGFYWEIIFSEMTESAAYEKEIELIASFIPKANISKGGNGGNIIGKLPQSRREAIALKKSKSMKGKNSGDKNGMHGNIFTSEEREESRQRNLGSKHPQYGKPKTPETRLKIRQALKPKMKPVLCLETGQIFESIRSLAAFLNADVQNTRRMLNKRSGYYKGFNYKVVS